MKYVAEFDGLRGVLSTMVVIAHLYPPLVFWVWGTMDMFFSMSGFLIGALLLRNQHKSGFYRNYALRRVLRIWPSYYFVVGACFFAWVILRQPLNPDSEWEPGLRTLQYFLFLQNVEVLLTSVTSTEPSGYIPLLGHGWSVALEEQFYLLAPFLCMALAHVRRPRFWMSVFFLVVTLLGIAGRISIELAFVTLPFRSDGFVAGLLLATFLHFGQHQMSRRFIQITWVVFVTAFVALAILYLGHEGVAYEQFSSLLFSVGTTIFAVLGTALLALILAYQGGRALAPLRNRVVVFLGQMSYSTYLWHVPVIWYTDFVFKNMTAMTGLLQFSVRLVLCFLVAYAAYLLIERPLIAYRHRIGSPISEKKLVSGSL